MIPGALFGPSPVLGLQKERHANRQVWCLMRNAMLGAVYFGSAMLAAGQVVTAPPKDPIEALRAQMEQLRVSLMEMNDQLAGARRESRELRQELQAVREQLDVVRNQPAAVGD